MTFKTQEEFERFVLAQWLTFGSRPKKAEPEVDGSHFIGQIDDAILTDQRLERAIPYSVYAGRRGE